MGSVDPGASSITVAVRVRPFTIREAAQLCKTDDGTTFLGDGSLAAAPQPKLNQRGIRSVIKVVDDRCLVFDPPEDNPVQRFTRSVVPKAGKKVKDQVFAFDRIFDENASQTDVYEGTTKQLLDSVLDGYNATVFAYGATGCGKTHTITGTSQMPGIIFLTMQELFEKIADRSDEKHTDISLSYLEIYNETIRDLLVPGGSTQGLTLREDSNQAVTVAGLTSHHPKDVQEVMDMIVQGNEYRTVSPTAANATSSRSHAVLQINVAQKDKNAAVSEPHTMATLSIIDLAGSERASATLNRGQRLMEGANINKSLLALGSCINALCDPRKTNHVPYRNSKLTRLLKFSLGGNCKTVMIVCVSPSSAHFDETQNTLRYANRAKNIQTKVTRNVFNVNRHVKDFLVKIDEQLAIINELKAQQKEAETIFFAKFQKQVEKRDTAAREGIVRIRTAYENSTRERNDKINAMKKLKTVERRISLLSAWMGAFDTVCDSREDQDAMPPNLIAMRKTAQGILVELEHSRQHLHQKIEKMYWERAIDSALRNSIAQLPEADRIEGSNVSNLTREAELLKTNFERTAYLEVMDHERGGDSAMVQILLASQFEMISSLSETLNMSEEEAVAHAKGIVNRLLETGYSAASNVIKPDGSQMPVELFSPTKRGTPKRRKSANMLLGSARPIAAPAIAPATVAAVTASMSPMKLSPRRRKVSSPRKGISFTPVKSKKPAKRCVRWRDDEGDEGLADYAKTPSPTKPKLTPEQPEPVAQQNPIQPPPVVSADLNPIDEDAETSPVLKAPEAQSLPLMRPNRFQAGFLSKGSRPSINGSPVLPAAPSLSLGLSDHGSSNASITNSPLRTVDPVRASNSLSPATTRSRIPSPKPSLGHLVDENHPPSASGSDSESPLVNPRKLRNALTAKRAHRVSSIGILSGSTSKRVSSIGSNSGASAHYDRQQQSLASSTNGVSRSRRGSAERRRSPPITCSPPDLGKSLGGSFTPGQARRMNFGGSMRGGSPGGAIKETGSRRVTIGSMGAQGRKTNFVWR